MWSSGNFHTADRKDKDIEISLLGMYLSELHAHVPQNYVQDVQSGISYNSFKLQTTQVSPIAQWINIL